jgi:hypothetical protein
MDTIIQFTPTQSVTSVDTYASVYVFYIATQ